MNTRFDYFTGHANTLSSRDSNGAARGANLNAGFATPLTAKPETILTVALSIGMVIGWIVKRKL